MSSRSLPVKLSAAARKDFIDILRYTGENRGAGQMVIYQDKLDRALQDIAQNPQIGRERGDHPQNYRIYLVGAHVIVYRTEDAGIGVLRILHQRMCISLQLS